jgi:hypothetical protein
MGPTVLLDKSALQSLSASEIDALARHYTIAVPLILVLEILADLTKGDAAVVTLSNKLRSSSVTILSWHKDLTISELIGGEIPLDGRAVINGISLITQEGETFDFSDEEPESKALRNWRQGNFSEAEKEMANRWKEQTSNIDLGAYKNNFNGQKFKTLQEAQDAIIALLNQNHSKLSSQKDMIETYLTEIAANSTLRHKVMQRWRRNPSRFIDFARYSYYCFCLNQLFKLGLTNGHISTSRHSKSRIDLEYLYYVPFSKVFCSNDKFHKDLAPHLVTKQFTFITGFDLKKDLKRIADEFTALNPEAQQQRLKGNYCYPPELPESFTAEIWRKLIKAGVITPQSEFAEKQVHNLSENEKREIIEKVKPYHKAITEHKSNQKIPRH